MTVTRLLALLLALAGLSMTFPGSSEAQQQIRIQIRNASQAPLRISVYDSVCRDTVFSGTLNSRAQRPVSLCPNRRSRAGHIIVYDRFGEERSYRVRQGQVLSLRARHGSGGLGR